MLLETNDFFAKVHLKAPTPIHELLHHRILKPRDVAVLYCMVESINPRSGRINLRPSALAERLNMQLADISATLKRLRDVHVLVQAKDKDTGGLYYLICPQYVSVGHGDNKRAYLGHQFAEAMQKEYDTGKMTPTDGPVAVGASTRTGK